VELLMVDNGDHIPHLAFNRFPIGTKETQL